MYAGWEGERSSSLGLPPTRMEDMETPSGSKGWKMNEPRVLIVDDEKQICTLLETVFSSWEMSVASISNPLLVADEVQRQFYNIILLDIFMPGVNGIELLTDIGHLCPETKVIIMTGCADKEIAIKALRMGAFDFLEKPIALDLLDHAVRRALSTQRIELEHKKTLEELKDRNKELLETNAALSVLTRDIERTRQETEKLVILQVRSLIVPLIEDLKKDKSMKAYESQLALLSSYIEDITSGLSTSLHVNTALSFRELRVVLMIGNDMTTEEIAAQLRISPETVKTHRRNIRKKLGIAGKRHKLNTYVRSMENAVAVLEHSRGA
jgi:FixJ family two-component response regulator